MDQRQQCAGGIVFDAARRILLIERGQPPSQGSWSVPGGRCRPGESARAACVREVREETGLDVEVTRWLGQVERPAPDGSLYVIDDYVCVAVGGELRAGDDAADARWVTRTDLAALPTSPGLVAALASWGVLPD